jgi:GT2 family glycosyltransferase/Gpi18-like mannosyltransferase
MTSRPLISVIIVNYNAGELLSRAIKSASSNPRTEVVVVDNSPPNKNLGFSRAVNQGIKQSRGEYICLLNPDATISKESLSTLVKTSRQYHDQAVIVPRLLDEGGTPQPSCYRPQTIGNAIKEFWFGKKGSYSKYLPSKSGPVHSAVAACWLMSRKVWDKLGGFSEKFFLYFEDLDFCDRASRAGIQVIYESRATATHVHGASSATNPATPTLFATAARVYQGLFRKLIIDTVIRIKDFFVPPVSTKKIIGIFLLYSLGVLSVTSLGYFLLPARYAPSPLVPNSYHSNFLLWSWLNFDGQHYLSIARNGYQVIMGQSEYAFFPLLPLLINLLSRTGLDLYLSARVVTLSASLGFLFALGKWSAAYVKNPLSLIWLVLLSPGTIFLISVYTEPLFLLLAALTFYASDEKQWGRAAVFTALATATRISGVFLVLFLAIKLLKSKSKFLVSSVYLLTSISGLVGYMIFLYLKTGDIFAWYHAQSGWEKSTATLPWVTISNYARALTFEFMPDLTHLVVAIEVGVTTILLYLLIFFWQKSKLDSAYKLYVSGSLALPLITGSLGSMPRFSLTLFPLFIVIPGMSPRARLITISCFLIPAIIGIILFTRGYWYA